MKKFIARTLFAFVISTGIPVAAELSQPEIDEERVAQLHRDFDYESFREHPKASQQIDFDDIDYGILSAATFHETNRVRARHNLPALGYKEELRQAAQIQARGMDRSGAISHKHPDENLKTLGDRVEHVGLQPAFSAENVAMSFGIQYKAGRPVVPREENGTRGFSYQPGGEVIPPYTYLGFAENLLDQWMASPGHRENILRHEPEQLGTGHQHATNEAGMDVFYSVQVFFTELDVPAGAEVIER